jgi:hypothetical protein
VEYIEVPFEATTRLTKDAAVWTENSTHVDTITDLLRFVPVPTVETLKNISQSRVYQFWKQGSTFPIAGSVILNKSVNGWIALPNHWSHSEGQEATLTAKITAKVKPEKYLLFELKGNTVTSSDSATPGISLAAPNAVQIEAALADYLAARLDGLQKLVSFKIFKQDTDPEDSSGTYRYSSIIADVQLAFTRPAVSLDADLVKPAPVVGAEAPENTTEATWKDSLYWDAGETLPFSVGISYRKEQAVSTWGQPTVNSIDPDPAPLKSKRTLRVRYKEADGRTLVLEATPVLRD